MRGKCRNCRQEATQSGYFFRCRACGASHWHRKVLMENLDTPGVLDAVLDVALISRTSPPGDHHWVYVIKLSGEPRGSLYVGMTGLAPEYRLLNHLRGHKASSVVKRRGTALLEKHGPMSYESAQQLEKDLAQEKADLGHNVYGGH